MSLRKALVILDALSRPPFEFKVAEISRMTTINRTTVHRILSTLTGEDFLIHTAATNKYKIGPMLYHVGSIYVDNFKYGKEIEETLQEVADITKESVGFAVREADKIISLYEVETHQPFRMNYRPGMIYPMNRGCYGKCLMAYHDQEEVKRLLASQQFEKQFPNTLTEPEEILAEYRRIREQGYVTSIGETLSPSAAGVGVPVFNRTGDVKGCMVVAFIKGPDYQERVQTYLEVLLEHARELTRYFP